MAVTVVSCGVSQPPSNFLAQLSEFDSPPNAFSSDKELREHLLVDESHSYVTAKKKFFVCLSRYPTSGTTLERVSCWYREPDTGKLMRVWDVRLVDAGPIKFDYDPKTTRLSLIAVANTPFKDQPVASVVLTVL